ncbi:hypothetical protein BH24ACT2_BH24ACT2_05490 [soil metagenome]
MAPPKPDQPHDLSAAISAALDDLIGPLAPEYVEERPPNGSRPPLDSGVEEELARTSFTHYGA